MTVYAEAFLEDTIFFATQWQAAIYGTRQRAAAAQPVINIPKSQSGNWATCGDLERDDDFTVFGSVTNNVFAERSQREWDHSEVPEPKRNADDGDAKQNSKHSVPDRKPKPGEEEPHHVADHAQRGRIVCFAYDGPAERPECKACKLEALNSERDSNDRDALDDTSDEVAQEQPESGKNDPQDVQYKAPGPWSVTFLCHAGESASPRHPDCKW